MTMRRRKGEGRAPQLKFTTQITAYLLSGFVLLALIFSMLYYVDARRTTENAAIRDIEHSLERTRSDMESLISLTQSVMSNLMADGSLYDALTDYEPGVDSYARVKRTVQPLLYDHIRNIEKLCAIQLLNDDYVFYSDNITYTSFRDVSVSQIYRRARETKSTFWTTVYDFTREYGHVRLEDKSLPIANRNLVSYVGKLNAFKVHSGVLEMWPTGRPKPVAVISIDETTLRGILENTLGQYTASCFLLDSNGMYLSHSDSGQLYQFLDAGAFERLNEAAQQGYLRLNLAGQESLLHYARLSNGWTLAAVTPRAAISAGILSTIINALLVILICALALSAVLALIVSHQLSRPINQLLQAIRITGQGNFGANLPDAGNEFDVLHTAFNQMVQRIDVLIRENYETTLRERENEMRILRYQTKPHFLYNALLIIRSTAMRSGDAETAAMVQNLSNILRYVLRDDQNFTTVRDEINNVLDYFEIVRAGYENAFELEVDVDPAMLNAVICKLTLQPLVENCVEHGFDNPSEGGRIRLTGRIVDGRVSLVVWDDGKPWPENFSVSDEECPSESIGMANVRRRMALTFGDACAFHIFTPEEGGAAVELTFPYRFGADFEDKRREIYS